jgi:hypothetical protein
MKMGFENEVDVWDWDWDWVGDVSRETMLGWGVNNEWE